MLPLAGSVLVWPQYSLYDQQSHKSRILRVWGGVTGLWRSMERSRMVQSSHVRVPEHKMEPEFQFILRPINVSLTMTPDLIQGKLVAKSGL